MEIILVPAAISIFGYVFVRLLKIDIVDIVQRKIGGLAALLAIGALLLPFLAFAIRSAITGEDLQVEAAAVAEGLTVFISDHLIDGAVGAVGAVIGGYFNKVCVKPFMDVFDL